MPDGYLQPPVFGTTGQKWLGDLQSGGAELKIRTDSGNITLHENQ
jgi:hypothetical protein